MQNKPLIRLLKDTVLIRSLDDGQVAYRLPSITGRAGLIGHAASVFGDHSGNGHMLCTGVFDVDGVLWCGVSLLLKSETLGGEAEFVDLVSAVGSLA